MWTNFNFFLGSWQGTGAGQPGTSQVVRSYQLILNDKYIQVNNRSTYPPQRQNPEGEIHEDLGLFSYNNSRKTYILRQFHIEGFVNQYVLDSFSPDGKTIVFVTESIENIAPGWRARETYQVVDPDEFTEIFELASPGKDFELYVRTQFKRLP